MLLRDLRTSILLLYLNKLVFCFMKAKILFIFQLSYFFFSLAHSHISVALYRREKMFVFVFFPSGVYFSELVPIECLEMSGKLI